MLVTPQKSPVFHLARGGGRETARTRINNEVAGFTEAPQQVLDFSERSLPRMPFLLGLLAMQ